MDEAVIKYYRRLLKEDFPNAGSFDPPSIFIEAVGEKMIHCGNTGNYMQLYLQVSDRRIDDIRYLCSCDPVANVAVEVLCTLARGKTLDEAVSIAEEPFYQILGSRDDQLRMKVQGLLELLREGIALYHTPPETKDPTARDSQEQGTDTPHG
jgi:NifU-like protein involved in Fe-S cluster formation